MTTTDMAVSIMAATPQDFLSRIDELVDIHLLAMNYALSAHRSRRSLWIANSQQEDFTCSIALLHQSSMSANIHDSHQRGVGVAFCFKGSEKTWWYQQVSRGLRSRGASAQQIESLLGNYAELSEIHVHPQAQHRGLGRQLLDDVLIRSPQRTALLSTPEVPHEANAAWHLYRSSGFEDLMRNFYFPIDPRPFGILRRVRD